MVLDMYFAWLLIKLTQIVASLVHKLLKACEEKSKDEAYQAEKAYKEFRDSHRK